ncbi:MAG: hypothetical protein WCJ26_10440 [bacterium]
MKKIFTLLLFIPFCLPGFSQVVYEDTRNTGIYDFLDELANLKLITLNTAIKPYSRNYIAQKLYEAQTTAANIDSATGKSIHPLNKRQQKELTFYLRDFQLDAPSPLPTHHSRLADAYPNKLAFIAPTQKNMVLALNPLGFHYEDSLFTFSIRPILGFEWTTNENAAEYHRWWGGSMFGYIGENFGFYASLRDNNESTPMARPEYFTLAQGQVYKNMEKGAVDYSEMRGGIVASVKWGSLGIINDRVEWGDNYHGANILSGKAPAFPSIQLHLNPAKWFDFSYMHGWLNSNVLDSSRSYYDGDVYRQIYRNKYIAANMFTFIPWRGLNLSFGNSIIYSDINVNPLYLIPFLFYNSVDATKNNYSNDGGSNSQFFFNLSSRQIRHLHLFISFFVDEWKTARVMEKDQHNFTSLKAGFRLSDFPVQNLSLTAEYTRTQPMTYDHYISTTTFASNDYVMGNYLRENSQEIYVALSWRPLRGVLINASYTLAQHGDDVPYTYNAGYAVDQIPFLKNKTWQNSAFSLSARYEFVNNGYFFVSYMNSSREGDVKFQPEFMRGKTNTLSTGINVGF